MVTEQASNGMRVKSAATRLPGLDGVRALAVIAVIAFHEQLPVLPGGFLGVDVFFVLSGYLITDLLVAQWHQHGRLRLGNFWARRARRLLPALATMLVVVTAATAIGRDHHGHRPEPVGSDENQSGHHVQLRQPAPLTAKLAAAQAGGLQ